MIMQRSILTALIGLALSGASAFAASDARITVVDRPGPSAGNDYYVGNRPPLLPSPLYKLPIGSIDPKGWLREQLERMADGYFGHMEELSKFTTKKDNAWLDPQGEGRYGWEEVPYWLRGYTALGYVLGDEEIIQEAEFWIQGVFSSQRESGYFGPQRNLHEQFYFRSDQGKAQGPDLWPNMLMLQVFQLYYEHTRAPRILEFMLDYARWMSELPEGTYLVPYWQKQRGGDQLASILWLYNRTGEKWLLDLARRTHRRTADWIGGVPTNHNVNLAMGFRELATFYLLSHNPEHLQATWDAYHQVMSTYGQMPGGIFAGDERVREGYTGPRQMLETCGMAELMHSFEMLLRYTGDPRWADLAEEIAFNSFPAAFTPDYDALHYLTGCNMTRCDKYERHPAIANHLTRTLMNPFAYRCCQHNTGFGWPYYAQNLWMATPGNGLAATLYAASAVHARVGEDGQKITIHERTRYPFEETIQFTVETDQPVTFPLYLRIPGWCEKPRLRINREPVEVNARPNSYIRIERTWRDGDRVALTLPMEVRVKKWEKYGGAVSIHRGPLAYSIKIQHDYDKVSGPKHIMIPERLPEQTPEGWPAYRITPASPWNYGLVLDDTSPAKGIEVVHQEWPESDQPFTVENAPIELRVKAKRIPHWRMDRFLLPDELQPGPVRSNQPTEIISLIPMGAARLRISVIPVIGSGTDAHRWQLPDELKATREYRGGKVTMSASYVWRGDSVRALLDGKVPSSPPSPRFTWWPLRGGTEWVQYTFDQPRELHQSRVVWFDDRPKGGCRVPKSWTLLYKGKGDERWKPVPGVESYPIRRGEPTTVEFEPIQAKAIRLRVRLWEGFSGGILEWQVR